jgi:tyrosinase
MNFVRRDIWTLGPEHPIVEWYGEGVRRMKLLKLDETLSWEYQAAIHGIPSGQKPLWNQCQHAQWFFLPWHRMYVLRVEAILRAVIEAAAGPTDWALPYWNYGLGGKNATLPLAFRNPQAFGKPNPLYVQQRQAGLNEGRFALPAKAISAAKALARPHFIGAAEFGGGEHLPSHQRAGLTGRIEETPHNDVHVEVGGRGGWMAYPETAAKDPIFWLHHTNIDRLWEVWKESKGHVDPADQSWTEQEFKLFDTKGNQVGLKCGQVESIQKLGYEYDPKAPKDHVPSAPPQRIARPDAEEGGVVIDKPHMVGATDKPITLVGEPVEVEIPIDAKEAGELSPAQNVYLNSEDIEGERNPGTVYAVYVALPPDASPEEAAAHHVGNLSFFGIERNGEPAGDEAPHGFRLAVDITPIAQELAARDEWGGHPLHISIEPLTLEATEPEHRDSVPSPAHPDLPITIGRISVFYDA